MTALSARGKILTCPPLFCGAPPRESIKESSFFQRSFLNLTVKKYENWSTVAEVIVKINWPTFLRHDVYLCCTSHSQT